MVGLAVAFEILQGIVEGDAVLLEEGMGFQTGGKAEPPLQAGFTSGKGLGMGLPGARRLMDEMEIDSVLGRGTTVVVRKWRR